MNSTNEVSHAAVQRDRLIVLASLVGIAALAWLFTFRLSADMDPMMPANLSLTVAMWLVMMIAMMTPSVSPTLLMFTNILRSRADKPFTRVSIFLLGYLLIWSGFSVVAALAQLALHGAVATTVVIGGAVLVAAGIFQFTPLKHACLTQCRSPQGFFMTEWRAGARGALAMGFKHGAYCLGCCWLLMVLFLLVGAMNLAWIIGLTILILAEKIAPLGVWLSRAAGVLLIGAGAWIVIGAIA